ncbi:MAG TPA: farnesyl diphosphate synthase [Mycobacteriales bacterium]|nr:farnesyl diphosphate synthase [Mycobacteriales bacterium]
MTQRELAVSRETLDNPDAGWVLDWQSTALRQRIDRALADAVAPIPCSTLFEAMRYSVLGLGKRLRPILCLISTEITGGSPDTALPTACALEMLHAATLIHDDLPAMDNDDLRRGRPANHKVFGEGMALLGGDALLAYSLEYILTHTKGVDSARLLRVVDTLVRVVGVSGLTGGQAMDLEFAGRDDVGLAELELMHSRKTAALIQASVATGAILAGASDDVIDRLWAYAGKLGLAYQIVDDVLDETGTSQQLGKTAGSDRVNYKVTVPRVLGVEGSMARAAELVGAAKAYLDPFGDRAEPLRAMADYTCSRQS